MVIHIEMCLTMVSCLWPMKVSLYGDTYRNVFDNGVMPLEYEGVTLWLYI